MSSSPPPLLLSPCLVVIVIVPGLPVVPLPAVVPSSPRRGPCLPRLPVVSCSSPCSRCRPPLSSHSILSGWSWSSCHRQPSPTPGLSSSTRDLAPCEQGLAAAWRVLVVISRRWWWWWVFLACRPVPLRCRYPPCEQGLAAVGVLSCRHLVVTIELKPKKEEKKCLVS